MKVQTSRFGEIEVPDSSSIRFPEGIVGFRNTTEFVMFDCGDQGVFKWLQSTQDPEIAFVICEANLIVPNYQIIIGNKEAGILGVENADDLLIALILSIPDDPHEMTANLLGPLLFNVQKRTGMQVVLINPAYSTRFKVFAPAEDAKSASKGA